MENNFWKTPEGKILSHGIHDHNNGSAIIAHYIKELERKAIQNQLIENSELLKAFEGIKIARKRCMASVDYIYNNIKKIHDEAVEAGI